MRFLQKTLCVSAAVKDTDDVYHVFFVVDKVVNGPLAVCAVLFRSMVPTGRGDNEKETKKDLRWRCGFVEFDF